MTLKAVGVVNRDGSSNKQVIADGEHPIWVDDTRLIVQRTVGGNTDLYLVKLDTGESIRLTTAPGADVEPAFTGGPYCIYLPTYHHAKLFRNPPNKPEDRRMCNLSYCRAHFF